MRSTRRASPPINPPPRRCRIGTRMAASIFANSPPPPIRCSISSTGMATARSRRRNSIPAPSVRERRRRAARQGRGRRGGRRQGGPPRQARRRRHRPANRLTWGVGPPYIGPLRAPALAGRCGGVAQLVRVSACHAEGRGFEPRRSRHFLPEMASFKGASSRPTALHLQAKNGSQVGRCLPRPFASPFHRRFEGPRDAVTEPSKIPVLSPRIFR